GSWDGYKWRTSSNPGFATVPTDLMRTGNFREWVGGRVGTDSLGRPVFAGTIYDPLTNRVVDGQFVRDPFQSNSIPPSRLSSVSRFFQERVFPAPTGPGTQLNWFGPPLRVTKDFDHWSVKVDNNFWQNHALSVGLDVQPQRKISPGWDWA